MIGIIEYACRALDLGLIGLLVNAMKAKTGES